MEEKKKYVFVEYPKYLGSVPVPGGKDIIVNNAEEERVMKETYWPAMKQEAIQIAPNPIPVQNTVPDTQKKQEKANRTAASAKGVK